MPKIPTFQSSFGRTALLTASLLAFAPVQAQTPLTESALQKIEMLQAQAQGLQRAVNLARETATKINGGLRVYRPARCMYETSSNSPCLIKIENSGLEFRFLGGPPGWQQLGIAPSVETEIRISSDGRGVLGVDYNGPPR